MGNCLTANNENSKNQQKLEELKKKTKGGEENAEK